MAGASCPYRSPVVSVSARLLWDGRLPTASRHASGREEVMGIPTTLGGLPVPPRPTPRHPGPRLWLALLAVLAAAGPAAPAERFPLPPVAAVERGAYRARDLQTGRALWEGEWVLSRETRAGRTMLDLHENGKGIRDSPVATVWTEHMRLDLWGPHPVLTASREERDADGVLVHRGQREFDFERGAGQQVSEDVQTGDTRVRAVSLTAQAIPTELLSALLRLLPARHGSADAVRSRDGRGPPGRDARLGGRARAGDGAGRDLRQLQGAVAADRVLGNPGDLAHPAVHVAHGGRAARLGQVSRAGWGSGGYDRWCGSWSGSTRSGRRPRVPRRCRSAS